MSDSVSDSPRSILVCCVGHQPPAFEPPLEFTMISPVGFGLPNALVVPDDRFGEQFHGSILSEYTQLFGLAEYLQGLPAAPTELYIFQYRKFATTRIGSAYATNMSYAFAATRNEAHDLCPGVDDLKNLSGKVLTGPVIRLPRSLADNYARNHLVEDFVALAVVCSMAAGFDPRRVRQFINCEILFPAPSISLIPTQVFLGMMSVLWRVWQNFAPHYLHPREGYQRRVGGFLLERLHSFLLLEYVTSLPEERRIIGHQIVVSDSNVVQPTI